MLIRPVVTCLENGKMVNFRAIYVRSDGQILYGQQAVDERNRSIARRKAADLKKLWEAKKGKKENNKKPSKFSFNLFNASTSGGSANCFASTSKGRANAFNASARGASASASATREGASVSLANAHATGVNASVSASASGARVNAFNANATGLSTTVSATADGVSVAAGNVSVTGVEVAASASASVARVNVGNVDITGASAGASAKVNGTGVSAFNVCVGGPSAAASVNVDGGLSFGNVNLGLRPSLDIGVGLNIGIPFMSGSKLGGNGNGNDKKSDQNNNDKTSGNNNNDKTSDGNKGDSSNQGGIKGLQQSLSEKFPNRRYYAIPVDYPISRNTAQESIDPLLPDDNTPRSDTENPKVDDVVNRHEELVKDGKKFVGFKGHPPSSSTTQSDQPPTNNNAGDPGPTEEKIWSGMYTSPSPDVAKGYAMDEKGHAGGIDRVYVPEEAAPHYYTNIGLETQHGEGALKAVKEHSKGKYIFSGPQDSKNPDLFPPETVISPDVRDKTLQDGTIHFEPSAHEIDPSSYQFTEYYNKELDHSKIVPDYHVGVKTADDCARDGGRERLAHVFQGEPPNIPPKKKELSEDDKLLLEECKKLGIEIPPEDLENLKKDLRSDKEYEAEEDAQNQFSQRNSTETASGDTDRREEEENDNSPPEPCRDHPQNFRCMRCIIGSSGPRIRRIQNNTNIHGFNFRD